MPAVCKLRNLVTGVPHLVLPGVHLAGRSEEAEILLADESISRRHARIYNTEDGLMVEDLGSSNGTYIQGKRIEGKVRVGLGEEIQFGAVTFRLDPEVGEAGGLGERLASKQRYEPEQMRRRTNKISAEQLGLAKALKHAMDSDQKKPGATVVASPQGGKYPGRSLFEGSQASVVTPVVSVPQPSPSAAPSAFAWFLGGLAVGVMLGLMAAWCWARFF